MITEKMLSAINDIDDEMIADAAPGSRYEKISYAQRRRRIYRVASLAACLCIVVAVLAVTGLGNSRMNHAGGENSLVPKNNDSMMPGQVQEDVSAHGEKNTYPVMPSYSENEVTKDNSVDDTLVKIGSLSPLQSGAGGIIEFCPKGTVPGEGFIEPSDVPEKMAVYQHEEAVLSGEPIGLDKDEVTELLNTYAQRLGISTEGVTENVQKDESGKERLFSLTVKDGNTELSVDAGAGVHISMPEGSMPADVNSILELKDPVVTEYWIYSASAEKDNNGEMVYTRWLRFITDGDDPLRDADLYEPFMGSVTLHYHDYTLVTEKLGEYPVISPAEALELLKEGKYNAPAKNPETEFPGEELITGLRLEYPLSPTYEYIVPYYVFTVMLPDVDPGPYNIKDADAFVEYYVPAVDARYFESDTAIFIQ